MFILLEKLPITQSSKLLKKKVKEKYIQIDIKLKFTTRLR